MCQQNEFNVDATNIPSYFTTDSLRAYSAVVFPSTTGHVLNYEQQYVFRSYYESGKGFVGIHAAADTEYGWTCYNELLGGYFANHPSQSQNATLNVVDQTFIATMVVIGRFTLNCLIDKIHI